MNTLNLEFWAIFTVHIRYPLEKMVMADSELLKIKVAHANTFERYQKIIYDVQ